MGSGAVGQPIYGIAHSGNVFHKNLVYVSVKGFSVKTVFYPRVIRLVNDLSRILIPDTITGDIRAIITMTAPRAVPLFYSYPDIYPAG